MPRYFALTLDMDIYDLGNCSDIAEARANADVELAHLLREGSELAGQEMTDMILEEETAREWARALNAGLNASGNSPARIPDRPERPKRY